MSHKKMSPEAELSINDVQLEFSAIPMLLSMKYCPTLLQSLHTWAFDRKS